ncbi:MAG: zinc ribbon domain-containing protein [Firmicutes bacterium]|nr:zinc ribbon domain-containing protein [Bacillota bacterium]
MDKYNLNEKSKIRSVFKIAGPITLGVGVILLIIAMVDFFGVFNGNGGFPTLFFLGFIGIPLIGIGAAMTQFAYMGKIARYTAGQMAPVAKDVTNYMLDGTKDSISGIVSSVANEIKAPSATPSKCPSCGETTNPGAVFCDHCGRPLFKVCPECNTKNNPDARFCQKCGKPMGIY